MSSTSAVPQELVEPFVLAAHGNLSAVKELYGRNPALLNVPWARFDETALAASSHTGNRDIAQFLLAQGAPMTICAAAMLGLKDEVAAFLARDRNLANARGAHGISLLYHAAMSGRTEIPELLLASGGGDGIDGALHGAVLFDHLDMVSWLLTHGVHNPNAPDFEGRSPLFVATERGYRAIADALRSYGASLESAADVQ